MTMTVFRQMILMVMTTMADDNKYDGRSKHHDVVLQEVGSSSEEEEDDDNEQEVNDDIEDEFCSEWDNVLQPRQQTGEVLQPIYPPPLVPGVGG